MFASKLVTLFFKSCEDTESFSAVEETVHMKITRRTRTGGDSTTQYMRSREWMRTLYLRLHESGPGLVVTHDPVPEIT